MIRAFLSVIALLISAQGFSMADYLKDGTVFVAIKNGRIYEFSSNNWKVVKRYKDGPDLGKEVTRERVMEFFGLKDAQDETPPKVIFQELVEERIIEKKQQKRHTIIGHLGGANEKYVVEEFDREVVLKEEYELALGITYQYNFENDWSFGATVINRTASLNLGYNFD